jgi:hypothetical protein
MGLGSYCIVFGMRSGLEVDVREKEPRRREPINYLRRDLAAEAQPTD